MLKDKWALVVEDDAHSLVAIASILRDLGIRFKRNTTGANVPEQIRAMNPPPDFVLLDVDLPNGDAFAITRKIHTDPVIGSIPVIAIVTRDQSNLRSRIRHSGFASFIIKPFPRRNIKNILERILAGEQVWEAVS